MKLTTIASIKSEGKATPAQISEFEKWLGFPLPLDFREVLLAWNWISIFGAQIQPLDPTEDPVLPNLLFGFHDTHGLWQLNEEFRCEIEEDMGRSNGVLIGNDPGGNWLVLLSDGIWWWDRLMTYPRPLDKRLVLVAENFRDFFARLNLSVGLDLDESGN